MERLPSIRLELEFLDFSNIDQMIHFTLLQAVMVHQMLLRRGLPTTNEDKCQDFHILYIEGGQCLTIKTFAYGCKIILPILCAKRRKLVIVNKYEIQPEFLMSEVDNFTRVESLLDYSVCDILCYGCFR